MYLQKQKTAVDMFAELILLRFPQLSPEELQDILQTSRKCFKNQILMSYNKGMINQMQVEMENITQYKTSKSAEDFYSQIFSE